MVIFHNINNIKIAIPDTENLTISCTQDAVDLLGEAGMEDCSRIIIHESNLHKDFFNLKSGLAGEILQKFSNYRCKLAIIGDFSKFKSKNFQEFIRESNRGNRIFFVENHQTAMNKLTDKTM
jgi:hypothetical protein